MSSNYWPKRPSAKGFSIEKLSDQCRATIIELSKINNKLSQKSIDLGTCQLKIPEAKAGFTGHIHWANRDFREYINVA